MNSLVDLYRKSLAEQGVKDDRDDYTLTREYLGPLAQQQPELLEQYPDFAKDYADIREANAPSLGAEVGRGFKRGGLGLLSTGLGGLSLFTGDGFLRRKARELDQAAGSPDLASTIPTMQDIGPGEDSTASKIFSRDAIRYAAAKLGESAPSLGEAAVLAVGGGLIGSAVEPGAGTVIGAGEGAIEGLLGRGVIRSAIKELVKKGAEKGLTEEMLVQGIRAQTPEVVEAVTAAAKQAAGAKWGTVASGVNSYLLNSGDVLQEVPDRPDLAAGFGLISALPDTVLPAILVKRLFPGVTFSAGEEAAKELVGSNAVKLAQKIGVLPAAMAGEYGNEWFQEAVDVVARNVRDGKDPLTFTDADYRRFNEAGITGAAGGLLASPALAFGGRAEQPVTVTPPGQELTTTAQPGVAPIVPSAPMEPIAGGGIPLAGGGERLAGGGARIAQGDPATRLQQLMALPAPTPEERVEIEQLQQTSAPAASEVIQLPPPRTLDSTPAPAAETTVPPVSTPVVSVAENPVADYARYQEVQSEISRLTKEGRTFDDPDVKALWAENEAIKNRNSSDPGMPPEAPAAPSATQPVDVIAEAPKPAEVQSVVPSTQAPVVQPATPEAAAQTLQRPTAKPLQFGPVVQGEPSIDFAALPATQINPEQWEVLLRKNLETGRRGDNSGNRALTRVAVALENPTTGEVVLAGLTTPQRVNKSTGGVEVNGLALQRMGTGREKRTVKGGGDKPALVREVVTAGWKPVAVLHFDEDPGTIFQKFKTREQFSAAWDASGRNAGAGELSPMPTLQISDAQLAPHDIPGIVRVEREIDRVANAWAAAQEAGNKVEVERLTNRYSELSRRQEALLVSNQKTTGDFDIRPEDLEVSNRIARERTAAQLPVDAARAAQFMAVVDRLRNQGGRVDLLTREFFQQGTLDYIQRGIAALRQKMEASDSSAQRMQLARQIDILNERAQAVGQAQGATFGTHHIALAMADVQNANMGNLVTLLHEAAEQQAAQLAPRLRGAVVRAVEKTIEDLRTKAREAAMKTGVPVASETNAEDLLAESLAQRLAAEGISESTSLAQAIVRWVKDLYYRIAMAAQRAFGAEPDAETALAWFENQLRRVVSGDFDYRLARLLDPFMKQPVEEQVRRFTRNSSTSGTAGGVTDYFDPYSSRVRQPAVLTESMEAFDWNVRFRETENPGDGLEIPAVEARARQHAAAVNRVQERMEGIYAASGTKMPWAEWWGLVGTGDDPRQLLTQIAQSMPGVEKATIGGERMTDAMSQGAALEARAILEEIQAKSSQTVARLRGQAKEESEKAITAARQLNEVEADRRNAELHEGVLKQRVRDLVKRFVADYSRGLSTADQHGALAEAVRNAEQLLESDPIPDHYQEVFQKILNDEIPIWSYMREIAKLDLPLSDLTPAEVRRAIKANRESSPELAALSRNKALLVALSTLATKNQSLLDDIALGRERDAAKYAAIHTELEEIRRATPEQLRAMLAEMDERGKATSLRERIRDDYLKRRRDLRNATARVQRANARADTVEGAVPKINEAVEQAQIEGGTAPSTWQPLPGSSFTVMYPNEDGSWGSFQHVLAFNEDGSAKDGKMLRRALYANNQWLKENAAKRGGKFWQTVERQTIELGMLDLQRQMPAVHTWKITRMLSPIVANARRLGGSASQQVVQMLNRMDSVIFTNSQAVQANSHRWAKAWRDVSKSTGITDPGVFRDQVYDPANYFISVNPGLDEQSAIRQATKFVRDRLPNKPDDNFGAAMAELLRETYANNEYLQRQVAEKEGLPVQDPRLKSGLRRAVPLAWLTNMRQLDGALVARVVSDMNKAGWRLGMKEERVGEQTRRVVTGATTFQDLTVADTGDANTQALSAAVQKLFTPGIIRDWLLPFINKGGTEIFSFRGNPISTLDVQDAWATADGNVLKWIDNLATRIDVGNPITDENGQTVDPVAEFRLSMLRQLDGLFGMEAKQAYEWSQTRDMFDPLGPKRHVMMDARLNDQIPMEHLNFATYDEHSAQMLLSEVAFHSKLGRNGESMVQALSAMADESAIATAVYQSIKETRPKQRELAAKALGYDYKELKNAANRAGAVQEVKNSIEGLFSVGRPGGPFDEARAGMEFMRFLVSQTIDTPSTGAYNWLSNFERPLTQRSLGPAAIKASLKATAISLKGGLGSVFGAFGIHLFHSSDYFRTMTQLKGLTREQQWSQAIADVNLNGENVMVKPLKFMRFVQNKGVGLSDSTGDHPRLTPIPGLGVSNYMGQLAGAGGLQASAEEVETMLAKGIDYFSRNHEAATDPDFRFKAKDVGLSGLDQGVFDFWRNASVEYGMGNLEDMVRDASARQSKGEPLLTKDQVLRIAQVLVTTMNGDSSINTTPSFLQDNPFLRRALPLLRWPFWKMHQVGESLSTTAGKKDYASVMRGLATLAMWNLPVGLAFTLLMDRYDEDARHKKSSLPTVGPAAAIPIIGPALEAIMADRSVPDTLKAYLVRSARAGNVYGIASDFIGQIASPADAASGRRIFSMDQRVFAMSQLQNIQQALTNAMHQDWDTTWASVWSPLFRSVGGNGALHAVDVANNLLKLDNAEGRQVMRINAANWLRAAASETDVPLRASGGAGNPTPMSVWTREMYTAAMANDRIGFMDAYQHALGAARKVVADDPTVPFVKREQEAESRVLSGWRGRDPLTIFAAVPTPLQINRMLAAMNEQGQQDVREALARYKQFTSLIKASPVERQMNASVRRMSNPPQLRQMMRTPNPVGSLF